jgi:hypothetical protein
MSRRPNELGLLLSKETKAISPYVDRLLEDKEGREYKLYLEAKVLNGSKLKKSYIEACMLASTDLPKIAGLLEIPLPVIEVYSKIFYDVAGLDRLSKLELVEICRDRDETNLKLWALSLGLDFIAWRLGYYTSISPVEGLNEMFSTCIFKSKEAMFNKNDSGASIESTKWVKLSIDIARLLKVWVIDSEGAKADLELALKEVMPNFKSIDDLEDFGDSLDITKKGE